MIASPTLPIAPPERANRLLHCLPIAAILLAAALRFYHIGHMNYWLDELMTLLTTTGKGWVAHTLPKGVVFEHPARVIGLKGSPPLSHLFTTLTHDDQMPPLYFVALRYWRQVFGDREAAIRALSALSSVIAVALLFLAVRNLYPQSRSTARWAALLMAVCPVQIIYAQEARPYAFATALLLGAFLAFARIHRRGPSLPRCAALAVCLAAAVTSHYFAAGPALGLALYTLLVLRRRTRLALLAAFAASGLLFAVTWGPYFLRQQAALHAMLVNFPEPHHLRLTLLRAASLPAYQLLNLTFEHPGYPRPTLLRPATADALTIAATALAVAAFLLCLARSRRNPTLLLGPLWLLATLALHLAMDLRTGSVTLYVVRYTLFFAPGLFLTLASALAPIPAIPLPEQQPPNDVDPEPNRHSAFGIRHSPPPPSSLLPHPFRLLLPHLLPACAAALALYGLRDAYLDTKGDWRAMARLISAHSHGREPVVMTVMTRHDGDWWLARGYLGLTEYYPRADKPPIALVNAAPSPDLLRRLRRSPDLWLFTTYDLNDLYLISPDLTPLKFWQLRDVGLLVHAHWKDAPAAPTQPTPATHP